MEEKSTRENEKRRKLYSKVQTESKTLYWPHLKINIPSKFCGEPVKNSKLI